MIGIDLDQQVLDYIFYLRKEGAVINTHVVIGISKSIVMGKDSNLLVCNGGGIVMTKDWAKNVLKRMGMVKRRSNTKAKVTVEEFDETKKLFLLDIKKQLTWTTADNKLGSYRNKLWTMETPGTKHVEIIGKEDKRQLTAVLGCSMSGEFFAIPTDLPGET